MIASDGAGQGCSTSSTNKGQIIAYAFAVSLIVAARLASEAE
jgi:hypothetical protein